MSTASKRLVMLTGNRAEHRYIAHRLGRIAPVEAIVVDVATRPPSLRRAFRRGTRLGLSRLVHFAFLKATRDRRARHRALHDRLGEEFTTTFPVGPEIIEVDGINSPEAIEAVRSLRPDALLVFGTAIVQNEMLALAADRAFNMHTGISPRYRGTDCEFWPLANGEPQWLGATVHECTAAVDGGRIFEVGAAQCHAGDGVHDAFARAVERGGDLYARAVRRYLAGELTGEPQDLSQGVEYRGYMRTLRPELRARWTLLRLRRERA
jgi:methionyl-tRNA formyltransferase